MKILDMRVNWHLPYGNEPTLCLLVDDIPHTDSLRFRRLGNIYYAEYEGYARFFSWNGRCNEGGYGGGKFAIKMADGSNVTLLGPWSSRAGHVNHIGFGPCLDISIADNDRDFRLGPFLSAAVTKALIDEALPKFLPEIALHHVEGKIDKTWFPTIKGLTPQQSKETIRRRTA
jgi:hypothetical protein